MRVMRSIAVATAAVLAAGLAAATPASAEIGPAANPETVTGQPVSTWQTNGTVWAIKIVNNVAYVGGTFTKVRPPGAAVGASSEVTRNRLAAFNATTGELLPWAPSLTSPPYTPANGTTADINCTPLGNGQVECAAVWSIAVTPDQKNIVVGGDFQAIDGKVRAGLASFSTETGALSTTFKPSVYGRINSVAATNTGVWIGGNITKAGGAARTGLAGFAFPSGALNNAFAPSVVRGTNSNVQPGVRALALTADGSRLLVGGGFTSLAGRNLHGLGALDPQSGAPLPWNSDRIGKSTAVTSLTVIGDTVYTTGEASGSVSEGVISFNAMTGQDLWTDGCRGASHSLALMRGVVYVGSHAHDCATMSGGFPEQYTGYSSTDRRRYTLRAEVPNGAGNATLQHWFPRTDDANGARAMATDDTMLWVGGEFTYVDSLAQQGLTRFTFQDRGAANRVPAKGLAPIATSTKPGLIDVAWRATEDADNRTLTYQLIRDGVTASPLKTQTVAASPWLLPWMSFRDDVADGSTHTYQVRIVDPLGRSAVSPTVTATAATSDVALKDLAKADGAAAQFSFENRTSSKYTDGVSGRVGNAGSGATLTDGNGLSGNAVKLSGASGGVVYDGTQEYSSRAFSLEAMVKTTSTKGGVLISRGATGSTTSLSSSNTGTLYLDTAGRLSFGLRTDAERTDPYADPKTLLRSVRTPAAYNDGTWHHVVATFEPGTGSRVFVDGALAATDPSMNWSRQVKGYLRVGGDLVSGWPGAPSNAYLNGVVDEVALYLYPLSPRQIAEHSDAALGLVGAPPGVKATATGPDSVSVTWRAVAGATGYRVFRDDVAVADVTGTSYADTGLSAKTTYAYRVAALVGATPGPTADAVEVTTQAPTPKSLITSGATWSYDVSGAPAATWSTTNFNDAAWPKGPSQLGFGEGDEATAISPFLPDGKTRRITSYFRTAFDLDDAPSVSKLTLRFKLDDGLVLYLNGTEVYRDTMPAGTVGPETLATTWAADDGQTWRTVTLPASALATGRNVLAAEVHQNARSSTDLTWDAELTGGFD